MSSMPLIDYSVADGVCVLRLNAPPVNWLTLPLLEELRVAVRRANLDAEVRRLVIMGDAGRFSAGADVALFRDIRTAEDAVRISRIFQEAFQEIEDSAKPVVAAVAGKTPGGALELALACHGRVCEPGTLFSMPEVTLGINPGAGGTQRLPRLMGVEPALNLLLTGQALNANAALTLGLVDAVCAADDLVRCASSVATPGKTRERTDRIADHTANEAALAAALQRAATGRPEFVAPSAIIEAVHTGLAESFEAGLRAEQDQFARCMATPATRNKIYVFFARRDLAKVPDLAGIPARAVTRVAVIGMGSMGVGIAQAVMQAGLPVTVTDADPSALENGRQRIRESLEKRVAQGRLSPERLAAMLPLFSATTDWQEIGQADLVIEAVFEDVAVKRTVLGQVERAVSDHALIASNTSTISLDTLAEGVKRPERFVGLHFFNPAQVMPLLEVIRRDGTSAETVASALQFAKTLGKTPILVRNREGFVVNRILIPYLKEAFWLLEDGAEASAIDQAMVAFGFPMGPLTLIDMAGIDILALTDAVLRRAFPRHGDLSAIVAAMVEGGWLGQKRGAGVYLYAPGNRERRANLAAQEIFAAERQRAGKLPRTVGADEITQRLIMRMVAEAFRVLEEGLAQRESDIDAAMVLGSGFPDWRGGGLKYARDLGLANVLAQLEMLEKQLGKRFAPCKMPREMKGT
ncbi:MAG: 3-hydroxyacyl-CoA dehydrogenase NAD-binding domain-containing protein [Verrucomicrobia bacterium]|nr:3-hydroxyacyl-CoA dehydrogenase NAD-binding domain-containing protein [Verrucomicrobiota bacterium]